MKKILIISAILLTGVSLLSFVLNSNQAEALSSACQSMLDNAKYGVHTETNRYGQDYQKDYGSRSEAQARVRKSPAWGRANCNTQEVNSGSSGGSGSSGVDANGNFIGSGGSAGTFTGLADQGCGRYVKGSFVWKPMSETTHKLVVLIPNAYTGHTNRSSNRIVTEGGRTVESGNVVPFSGNNDNREHYRFSKSGPEYPKNIYFEIGLKNGGTARWRIENDYTINGGRGCQEAPYEPMEIYLSRLAESNQARVDATVNNVNNNLNTVLTNSGVNSGNVCGVATNSYYANFPPNSDLCSFGVASGMSRIGAKILATQGVSAQAQSNFSQYASINYQPSGVHKWFCLSSDVNSLNAQQLSSQLDSSRFCRTLTQTEAQIDPNQLQSDIPIEYTYYNNIYDLSGYLVIPECYSYDVDLNNTSGNNFDLNITLTRQSGVSCNVIDTYEFEEDINYSGNINLNAYINGNAVTVSLFDRTVPAGGNDNESSTNNTNNTNNSVYYGNDYNYDSSGNVYAYVQSNTTATDDEADIPLILNLLVSLGVIPKENISQLEAMFNINITASSPSNTTAATQTQPTTVVTTNSGAISTTNISLLGSRNTNGTSTTFSGFNRDLTVGSQGADVKALQEYLNANGYTIATSGVGSPGNETTYFGPATQSALARFQQANGISPASGYFGPLTRQAVE
jgi:hypothetical protein